MDATNIEKFYKTCDEYFRKLSFKEFKAWFSKYSNHLRPAPHGVTLDVGCGAGQVVNKLAKEGIYCIGVDISCHAVMLASKSGGGSFIVASAYSLPFRNDTFDSTGSCDVLEHLPHAETCLEEMFRVLKPGGKVVVACPNLMRVLGFGAGHHRLTRGFMRRVLNLCALVRKALMQKIQPQKMRFENIEPEADPEGIGCDMDAVCLTNPIDIKFHLKNLGINLIYESALQNYTRSALDKIGELPLIRSVCSGIFTVGIKSKTRRRCPST